MFVIWIINADDNDDNKNFICLVTWCQTIGVCTFAVCNGIILIIVSYYWPVYI